MEEDDKVLGLTKENYFDEVTKKFPIAMNKFHGFIDQFKEIAEWEELFKYGIKFHNIPFLLQRGILLEFFNYQGIDYHCYKNLSTNKWRVVVVDDVMERRYQSVDQNDPQKKEIWYDTPSEAEVDGITIAFKLLHEQHAINFN